MRVNLSSDVVRIGMRETTRTAERKLFWGAKIPKSRCHDCRLKRNSSKEMYI